MCMWHEKELLNQMTKGFEEEVSRARFIVFLAYFIETDSYRQS